jgi:hypothetical protein
MASQPARQSVPKLCPRCGAFYQDLTSKTCPQCFAKLELLDDDAAASLIIEQERRASDPEVLQNRSAEDEKFKEQAFGACLTVAFVGLVTFIVCVAIIIVAAHSYRPKYIGVTSQQNRNGSRMVRLSDIDTVLPLQLLGEKQTEQDSSLVLPGSLSRVNHTAYANGVQVYAVESAGLTDDQNAAFRLAVSFAAKQHAPELALVDEPTQAIHFIVLAPALDTARQAASELSR